MQVNETRVKCYFSPKFFIKSSENNTPIDNYHAPGGFCKASTPAAMATPYRDRPEYRSHQHEKECLKILVTFFTSFSHIISIDSHHAPGGFGKIFQRLIFPAR